MKSDRWRAAAAERGLPAPTGRFQSEDTFFLTRADVMAHADADITPENAMELWYATMAWGLGPSGSWFNLRLDGFAKAPETNIDLLVHAWATVRSGASAGDCYRRLLTEKGKPFITQFGAAFATKYLYFAHGTTLPVRNLILDKVVATNLRDSAWPDSPITAWWATTYQAYCDLLADWAQQAADIRGAPVQPDEVEKAIFHM
ncbi:MAG: hypothetical protein Q8Q44_04635 [Nocardioides sp.]|nr:hypothetical protein [Nocardioides sp.]MDP3890492.1 hypothetical protein [Nocardioides sp.]